MKKIWFVLIFGWLPLLQIPAIAADHALLVGIEKYESAEIRPALGAERDVNEMERLLITRLGFDKPSIHKLMGSQAGFQKITQAVRAWLIMGTKPGDRIFFYYSGHGSYLPDTDGDEKDDGYDETILPYDTRRTGENQITDDQIAGWIAELPGRRIVMIFDSCHSGTLSRSLGSAKIVDETARSVVPADSVLQKQPRSRMLIDTTDGSIGDRARISPQSDAVLISASGPRQTAHSIKVGDQWHGALTYCLTEIYKSGMPSMLELKTAIHQQIRQWQQTQKLKGNQVPDFDISHSHLETEPLYSPWQNLPAIALLNPKSKLDIVLSTGESQKEQDSSGHPVYFEGEKITYQVLTRQAGYLYLFAFSQDPVTSEYYVTMLFPHRAENRTLEPQIPAGIKRLPENAEYVISATGLDITVALLSSRKLPLPIKARYGWEELFQALELKELQQAVWKQTRQEAVKPASFDWQAATLLIYTAKRRR